MSGSAPVEHSALYTGMVRHHRLSPRRHLFRYRLCMVYLDLAEIDSVLQRSPFWSRRPALARFCRSDFLRPGVEDLDQAVRDCVEEQTGQRPRGAIRLLTNLRYFGVLMNPLSCYYCFDEQDRLEWIVAEVTNTPWRESRAYVIPCGDTKNNRHSFDKTLHVSPFMPMDIRYHWRASNPGRRLALHISNHRDGQEVFNATLVLHRKEATPGNLNRLLLTYPLMSARIAIGIYWQALKLFIKRVPLYRHGADYTR